MSSVRRLLVLRHAKAEPFAESDQARALTARGRQSARDVGRHLREQELVPDCALVSTATRTRETWAEVAEGSGADPGRSPPGVAANQTSPLSIGPIRPVLRRTPVGDLAD